ncbi:MAG: hypothetical protein ACRC80_27190 [Waterburya sp.]
MNEISNAEKELGKKWIKFWSELKTNNSMQYAQTAQWILNRICKSQLNNPEKWMYNYLAYLEEIKSNENYNLLRDLIDLPEKPLDLYWENAWKELGWEQIQSYGAILFAAAKPNHSKRKSEKTRKQLK